MEGEYSFLDAEVEIVHAISYLRGSTRKRTAYQNSINSYQAAIEHINEAMAHNKSSEESEDCWQDLLYAAKFGQGFAEGCLERRNKGGGNGLAKSFCELEARAKEFNEAFVSLRREPRQTENHLRLGRAFGSLGLEGDRRMLDYWKYSDCLELVKIV